MYDLNEFAANFSAGSNELQQDLSKRFMYVDDYFTWSVKTLHLRQLYESTLSEDPPSPLKVPSSSLQGLVTKHTK